MSSYFHLINPVVVSESSDLFQAQPITFQALDYAKRSTQSQIEVNIGAVYYKEDESVIPSYIEKYGILETSILDYGKFQLPRKLPLLKDIFEFFKSSDSEYCIYSNVDISPLPFFYDFVHSKMNEDLDALIINRTTITPKDDLELVQLFTLRGAVHSGFDCFVIRRDIIKEFSFGKAFLANISTDRTIMANILVNATKFEIIQDQHVTFHIGDDKEWYKGKYKDYDDLALEDIKSLYSHFYQKDTINDVQKAMLVELIGEVDNIQGITKNFNRTSVTHNCRIKEMFHYFSIGDFEKILNHMPSQGQFNRRPIKKIQSKSLWDISPRLIYKMLKKALS